jgi:hypothetical protein
MEKELTEPTLLCDPQGHLNPGSVGWSRHPLHTCNVSGHPMRKKKWNYWCITTPEILFSITLSNIDYMGLAFAYSLDFATRRFTEQTVMVPFGAGCTFSETVPGKIQFDHKQMRLAFNDSGEAISLQVESPSFGGKKLLANLHISRPPEHETLNVVIPWSRDRFQFTSKQNCLPTQGSVKIGAETYLADSASAFACLDFGRGVWRYRSFWNWASFSGRLGSDPIGVNLGGGWTDGTGMTENGIYYNNILSKLSEDILFSYDPAHLMKPWKLKTKTTQRVDLTFTPFYERVAKTDMWVLKSEVHQMIGRFSGTLVPDNAAAVEVKDMIGWAEDHHARW